MDSSIACMHLIVINGLTCIDKRCGNNANIIILQNCKSSSTGSSSLRIPYEKQSSRIVRWRHKQLMLHNHSCGHLFAKIVKERMALRITHRLLR
jgi:hypothetical protein